MPNILSIIEHKSVFTYLESRGLSQQYKKAKGLLLSGDTQSVSFKKRKPYKSEKYYFRINRQYRAICYFDDSTLVIFQVDDHQN